MKSYKCTTTLGLLNILKTIIAEEGNLPIKIYSDASGQVFHEVDIEIHDGNEIEDIQLDLCRHVALR